MRKTKRSEWELQNFRAKKQFKKAIQKDILDQGNSGIDTLTYWGDDNLNVWGFTFAKNRDSSIREISNFDVISADLLKRFPKSIKVEHYGHWACGWIERVLVKTTSRKAFNAVWEWYREMQNYGVADEEDLSEKEAEEIERQYDSWYKSEVIAPLIEEAGIKELCDEDGNFNPSDKQDETIKWIFCGHANLEAYDEIYFADYNQKEFLQELKEVVAREWPDAETRPPIYNPYQLTLPDMAVVYSY